jgi:hypothetical protein
MSLFYDTHEVIFLQQGQGFGCLSGVLPVGCAVKCPVDLKMQAVYNSEQIKLSEFSILYVEISRSRLSHYERKLGQND